MKKRALWKTVLTVAAIAFVISACTTKPKLVLKQTTFGPGETITVQYSAPKGYKENAWVGIIPAEVEHGNETRNDRHDISYKYLKGSTAGNLNFTAPNKEGKYDFRMHDTDSDGLEVAYVSFLVIPKTKEESKAAEARKTMDKVLGGYEKGNQVMVEWKGSWWPAEIIKTRKGNNPYKIHYDGYSKSWDEWVGVDRIKRK